MNMEHIKNNIPASAQAETCGNAMVFEVAASDILGIVCHLRDDKGFALRLVTATDERDGSGGYRIWYVLGAPKGGGHIIPFIRLVNVEEFPSISPVIHEAWSYEKKIWSFFGLRPVGHPDAREIILHENWPAGVFPLRKNFNWRIRPDKARGAYHFQKVEGEGIYEIPVGPIHAGIIEPGHFRFSVAGEEIVFLEPRLGYVHKGSEKLFETLPLADKLRLSEKISGDSSFSHSLAYCMAAEDLSGITPTPRARYLRVIYAELERLANHLGDIGAIMLDTGFNFGGSHGARLRETVMLINERLTGSRFLRGVNVVGGVKKDINAKDGEALSADLADLVGDFSEVMGIAENSTSLLNRLTGAGVLTRQIAQDLGVMGVAGRAAGISRDARVDSPYAAYGELALDGPAIEQDGDVYARFRVRAEEVRASIVMIQRALKKLPAGDIAATADVVFKKDAIAVSVVEGWRGEIVYFVTTDSRGAISRVVPRDPSFVNWAALSYAGYGNVVPDFPLINKSFNMSYSGNDL